MRQPAASWALHALQLILELEPRLVVVLGPPGTADDGLLLQVLRLGRGDRPQVLRHRRGGGGGRRARRLLRRVSPSWRLGCCIAARKSNAALPPGFFFGTTHMPGHSRPS